MNNDFGAAEMTEFKEVNKTTMSKYPGEMVITTADFNGRVGELGQLEPEIVLGRNLSHGRKSKEKTMNSRGEDLLTCFETQGMVLINGRAPSDSEGELMRRENVCECQRSNVCGCEPRRESHRS